MQFLSLFKITAYKLLPARAPSLNSQERLTESLHGILGAPLRLDDDEERLQRQWHAQFEERWERTGKRIVEAAEDNKGVDDWEAAAAEVSEMESSAEQLPKIRSEEEALAEMQKQTHLRRLLRAKLASLPTGSEARLSSAEAENAGLVLSKASFASEQAKRNAECLLEALLLFRRSRREIEVVKEEVERERAREGAVRAGVRAGAREANIAQSWIKVYRRI